MSLVEKTPSDLVITPRNMEFGRGERHARWWNGGDPVSTTFYNALSITFPLGEAFFIESVRNFRGQVPDRLRSQIADFIRQEGVHSREHVEFNRHVTEAGYDLSAIEARLRERIREQRQLGPHIALAVTMCLEHLTAILAHTWLKDGDHFGKAPPDIARLWSWHAIEEVEHKSVAYDTFLHVTAKLPAWKRYLFRSRVMLRVTRRFAVQRILDMNDLFAQDGLAKPSTWFKLIGYLFGKPGLLRKIAPAWLAFFKPGFHPWDHDDRALLAQAEAKLAAA
jgi:predicted metal-dependent hydrolase